MDKKTALEDEHETTSPQVVDGDQHAPAKKGGPARDTAPDQHAPSAVMPVAGLEGGAEQARKTNAMQRTVGNTRLGRILSGPDHNVNAASNAAPNEEASTGKSPSSPEPEQEKGKGHV